MNIDGILNLFDRFIEEYLAYNKSVKWSFFHHHGSDGRKAAALALSEWSRIKPQLSSYPYPEMVHQQIMSQLHHFMKRDFLTGNYYTHSLKTYLLAYRDFVWDLRGESLRDDYPFEEVFEMYFKVKWEKATSTEVKDQYEKVSGIASDRRHRELVEAIMYTDPYCPHKFLVL